MMNKHLKKIKDAVLAYVRDPFLLKKWDDPDYYMMRDRNADNQLSLRTMRNRRKTYHYYGTSSMFIEDMFTGIMPFMLNRGEREKYPVTVTPSISREKEHIIAGGISSRGYPTFFGDALCDFARSTAHILFQDGIVIYEIIYKKNEAGEIESFSFEHIEPFGLYKFFGNYYQFISWLDAKASHTKVQIIKIPKEKILRIDFPKQLGGRRKINKILKRSGDLGKELFPDFQMKAMEKQEDTGFNSNYYSEAKYLEIAALTKELGWNQRQLSTNHITEYYALLRTLRQKKVEALVRETIFAKLNEALNGSCLNFGIQVSMDNLFTTTDIKARFKTLQEGNVTFMDLFNGTNL